MTKNFFLKFFLCSSPQTQDHAMSHFMAKPFFFNIPSFSNILPLLGHSLYAQMIHYIHIDCLVSIEKKKIIYSSVTFPLILLFVIIKSIT